MDAADPVLTSAVEGTARRMPSSRMHVLIVENHDDTRYLLGVLLEQLGHTVHAAANLGDAVAAAQGEDFDLLISDIGLPDGSGWELLERLGDRAPPYAIAMSGFGMASDRQKSLAAGFRHHLVKPVEPNQLDALIEEAAGVVGRRKGVAPN